MCIYDRVVQFREEVFRRFLLNHSSLSLTHPHAHCCLYTIMSTENRSRPAPKEDTAVSQASQPFSQKADRARGKPTIQIVLRKAPSPPRNQRSRSELLDCKQKTSFSTTQADMRASTAPAESVELITALSNPFLYPRPALLPALQKIIQSLEVAHSTVEAYAAGDYLTDNPVNVALGRVLRAWTEFISPLNAIHGLKALNSIGPGNEARRTARKAVGQKLLALAKDKQICVVSSKSFSHPFCA
jgi:hypothetical protein